MRRRVEYRDLHASGGEAVAGIRNEVEPHRGPRDLDLRTPSRDGRGFRGGAPCLLDRRRGGSVALRRDRSPSLRSELVRPRRVRRRGAGHRAGDGRLDAARDRKPVGSGALADPARRPVRPLGVAARGGNAAVRVPQAREARSAARRGAHPRHGPDGAAHRTGPAQARPSPGGRLPALRQRRHQGREPARAPRRRPRRTSRPRIGGGDRPGAAYDSGRRGLLRRKRSLARRRDAVRHPRLRAAGDPVRAPRLQLPPRACAPGRPRSGERRVLALSLACPAATRARVQAHVRRRRLRYRAVAAHAAFDRGGRRHQAHLARAALLPEDAGRPAREAFQHAQVPFDGSRRGGTQGAARREERAGGAGVQDQERPAGHARRARAPQVFHRRVASAHQCTARRHEPRRATPAGAGRGGEVRGLAAAQAFRASGSHLHLAGLGPQPDLLRRVDVPRHAVHRSLDARRRLQPHLQDRAGGDHGPRRELVESGALRPRDVALALLVVLLWGVNFAVIKVGLRGVSPFVLAGLRMVLTAFPAILLVERPRLPIRVFAGFALASFLMQFGLLFLAIKVGMPSGLASVVQQSQVFFTVLLAAAVFGERPRPMQLAGIVVAAAGLAIIGAQSGTSPYAAASGLRPLQAEPAPPPLAGFLLTLAAASFWAIGNLVSRSLSRYGRVSGLAFVVWSALIPPVPFFLLAWIVEGPGTIGASFRAMDAGSWAAVGYLAFGATLGGYGLWNKLLKAYPAAQVARFTLLVPVIGLACGAAFFGESLSVAQLAGCALVALGLALPIAAMWLTRLA